MIARLALMFTLCAPLHAQLLSFGIKGGVPLTTAFETVARQDIRYLSETRRYTFGGAVELRLPLGLGAEFDLLYKRLNYDVTQTSGTDVLEGTTSANSWEFPLLFKWRSPGILLRPYVTAGPTFRRLSDVKQFVFRNGGSGTGTTPAELRDEFSKGFAIGGGLEIGRRVRVAPEIRYTRWGDVNFQSLVLPDFQSNQNSLDFLVGIHF
jgi:hypothetical protein